MKILARKTRRGHLVIPLDLMDRLNKHAGKRGKSKFVAEVLEQELMRLEQIRTFEQAVGSIDLSKHPEWQKGSYKWVRDIRQGDERRRAHIEKHLQK